MHCDPIRRIQLLSFLTWIGPMATPSATHAQWPPVIEAQVWRVPDAPMDRREGSLLVLVRDVRRPQMALPGIQVRVMLRPGSELTGEVPAQVTDSLGRVGIVGTVAGTYQLDLRQIGHRPVRVRFTLPPNCPSVLEAYIIVEICDSGQCAAPSPRAVLTTCQPAA